MKPLTALLCACLAVHSAAARWIPEAIDLAPGSADPESITAAAGLLPPASANFTIGATPPEFLSFSVAAADTNLVAVFTAAGPAYVRAVTAARVNPSTATNAVWAYAVTSSVEVALATLTNGAAAWTAGIWLAAGDYLAVKSTNAALAVCAASIQQTRPAWTADTPARVTAILPGAYLPTSAVVTVSAVTSSVEVAELATFTGAAPAAWTNGTTLAAGDSIAISVAGATNSFPVTYTRQPAVSWSNVYTSATYLRGISAAAFLPTSAVVTVSAVTSSVEVAELATFTGAAPAAWADGLWLAAADSIAISVAGATNTATVALTSQTYAGAAAGPAPGLALRVWSARCTGPTNTAATLTYTPYLGVATNLATLTAAPYEPASALWLYPGDTLSVAAPAATNLVPVRLHAERFRQ